MDKINYFSILKQLHDICRDNPIPKLTGMDAYNEIINYLHLRHNSDRLENNLLKNLYNKYCTDEKIEEDKKNLDKKYSKIGKKFNFNYKKLEKKFLPSIENLDKNENIIFVKILGDDINNLKLDIGRLTNILDKSNGDHGLKAQKIINKIFQPNFLPLNENGLFDIRLFPYDAIGEGFEKFMNESGATGGNWGQYFTNIQAINWLINKVNITKKDLILDPYAGTGGFILQIKKKYNIPSNNIYAQEIDDKLYKFLVFNTQIACLDYKNNLKKCDTFDYYESLRHNENKFDKILTNPPFGESIDIMLSSDDKKKYWSFMKSGKNTIKNSMGLAVYSIIKSLKNNGIAGFVTDRGILNNGIDKNTWEKKLRKYMLESCNVSEILLLPKGIFSHTNFDTACIILQKGSKTNTIRFHQGYFKDEDKGTSNKIMYINEDILKITLQDIVNKNWSLKYDDYIEKKEDLYDGIKYETLDNICEFKNIETLKDDVCKKNGKYPYYNSSIIEHKLCDIYKDDDEVLIINKVNGSGKCKIFYQNGKYSSSSATIIFKPKEINIKYLIIVLKIFKNKIEELYEGQDKKSLKLYSFKKFKIPILPKDHQQRIVKYMDKFIGEDYNILDKMVNKFNNINLFKLLIEENYIFEKMFEYYEQIIFSEKLLMSLEKEHLINQKKKCFKLFKSDVKMLGEVCEFQNGKILPKNKIIDGLYPVIGGGKQPFGYHNNYNMKKDIILCSKSGAYAGYISKYNIEVYASDCFSIESKNNLYLDNNFLYYYLIIIQEEIYKKQTGNAQPHFSIKEINKFKIPIPSIEDQEKIVSMIENIEKEESQIIKSIEGMKNTIQCIYDSIDIIINDYIINDTNLIDNESDENINIDEDYTTEEEKEEKEDIQYT